MYRVRIVAILLLISSCKMTNTHASADNTSYALRLLPGKDLKKEIEQFVKDKNITAGYIGTCVGSLADYSIRFANQQQGATGSGHFEIVSLTGTVSVNGSHIHIAVSDSTGKTIGGHLLEGCKVYTTAELVIVALSKYTFQREVDGSTPYRELQIKDK
jgi:uncharacterized protein